LGDFTKQDEATGDFETRFIWETMEKMHVAAVSPGPRELQAWSTFKDLLAKGTIPVVASNVALKDGGVEKPIGVATMVIPVNGVKIGLFSLMGGAEFASARPPEGTEFAFHDPFQLAPQLVAQLRKQADMVVLMSQLSPNDTDRLVQAVPGIDVALYGQKAGYDDNAHKVGETIINQTGTRGQYLGKLVLIVDPTGKIVDFGSQNAALDTTFPEDPDVAKAATEATSKATELRNDARKQRQGEFEGKTETGRYLGALTCKRCHEKEYQQWSTSPHALAFANLDKPVAGKPRTAQCLACHTTGFGKEGGYSPDQQGAQSLPGGPPDLASVQCESCHGKGTEHTRTGKVSLGLETCSGCHTAEWSPKFDLQTALVAVKH
jgi:hypothetical protein